MSILAQQRERDPTAGFARDFIDIIRSLVPYWASGGRCRLIANAGGLNPHGCAVACCAALAESNCGPLKIGVITGDDVLDVVRTSVSAADSSMFCNLDTGASIGPLRDRLVTANAYLGAPPIVEALADGADIVITGRVADPSLVVAACTHHFGWRDNDFNQLAGATVAGHLIECGVQVTGGIGTDWLDVPDVAQIGFPIIAVAGDGSCIVTKPCGTGGRVTAMTVKEQLVYEIGDPAKYLSPDATVSFLSLDVEDLGDDRVRVRGAIGGPRPGTYKVSATYRDGFRSAGTLTIIGRDAAGKARRCGELVLKRIRGAGVDLRDSIIECLGNGDGAHGIVGTGGELRDFTETVLRVAVETETRDAAERFARELMPFITAGPQGTTGYAEGRPRIHPVFRYWPCLIDRDAVASHVEILTSDKGTRPTRPFADRRVFEFSPASKSPMSARTNPSRLYDIACARSGDKGTSANIGVIARDDQWWAFLRTWLTADRVSTYFSTLELESVERYELPNLKALNFVFRGALRRSLRTDAQGKALGQILLEMPLPADANRTIRA